MRNIFQQSALFALFGAALILNGCGGGSDDPQKSGSSASPPKQNNNTPPPSSDLAPTSIGGKTINGHIGGTSTTWQIVTTGGTSGSYSYSENGKYLNDGTYTWTKTGDDTGVLTLSPNNTPMDLNYTGANAGNYVYHANANYNEMGTFTTN
jgi:hypothetical protein